MSDSSCYTCGKLIVIDSIDEFKLRHRARYAIASKWDEPKGRGLLKYLQGSFDETRVVDLKEVM